MMTEVGASSPSTGSGTGLRDEPFEPEVVRSDIAFAGRVWDIRSETFRYGDEELTREYMDHPGAAAILALDDEGRVLLIQQYRHPIRHRDWELPAGLLDVPGEAPVEAAKRELAEEADLEAEHWEPLVAHFPTPGGCNEVIHIFLATGLRPAAVAHDREAEEADMRLEWVPLSDAADAVLDGRMRNGVLALGVLAAERRAGARRGA
ncbi:NUDIX domain-containing protein [Microbacterium sp. NIBRBAC000506063]|uniref:NUDIX domain-containing protein n=1 Tax=Microbacterium sp. NIBRBAC000506063 TaxID=2734618 RepID=UPI001CB6FF3A|nr:NUDIX hydrolase [Microbacterium sp. NIBRBAC000506063]